MDINKLKSVLTREEEITFALRALYSDYGYKRYRMSKFEEYDLYAGKKDYLVSDRVITFNDTDGRLLALKPDVTLSILKSCRGEVKGVQRLQYGENVYRVWDGSHSFRELMQAGLECIGEVCEKEICEVLLLAYESLKEISKDFSLVISSLELVDAILEQIGDVGAIKELTASIERKNLYELKRICSKHGIEGKTAKNVLALCEIYGVPKEVIKKLRMLELPEKAKAALDALEHYVLLLESSGAKERVCIDFSLGANRKYYNGIVFGGFVDGIPSSILKGGRYDKLAQSMGIDKGAVGFAVYLDELERLG